MNLHSIGIVVYFSLGLNKLCTFAGSQRDGRATLTIGIRGRLCLRDVSQYTLVTVAQRGQLRGSRWNETDRAATTKSGNWHLNVRINVELNDLQHPTCSGMPSTGCQYQWNCSAPRGGRAFRSNDRLE